MRTNLKQVAWVDGIHYLAKPVVRIKSQGITPCGRTWFMDKGHKVIYALSAYKSNV